MPCVNERIHHKAIHSCFNDIRHAGVNTVCTYQYILISGLRMLPINFELVVLSPTMVMWKRKGRIHLCSMILLALLWSGYTFAKPKQESLDQMRERSGQALQQSARGSGGGELLQHEKQLLTFIKSAGKSRDWFAAESCFKTYAGNAAPVFAATLHAAFLCGEYGEGALIYGKCKQRCSNIHPPVYAASLRIFAKLQDFEQVRAIWAEAMETCDLSEPLALARIAAAAEEGNVSEAAHFGSSQQYCLA